MLASPGIVFSNYWEPSDERRSNLRWFAEDEKMRFPLVDLDAGEFNESEIRRAVTLDLLVWVRNCGKRTHNEIAEWIGLPECKKP